MITSSITAVLLACWKLLIIYLEKKQVKTQKETTSTPEVVLPVSETVDKESKVIKIEKPIETIPIIPTKVVKKEVELPKEKEHKKDSKNNSEIIAQLVVKRNTFTPESTIGDLYIDKKFVCYTLEDRDRKLEDGGTKVFGETCIPRGTYEIKITWSNRLQCYLPILLNVPQFQGIRIHSANYAIELLGCLAVGFHKSKNSIQTSRDAVKYVVSIIAEKLKTQKVYIKIQ